MTTTLLTPNSAIAASASAIESAPPEQASPYRPGPSRSIHSLHAARSVLTGSRCSMEGMAPDDMTDRDTPIGPLAPLRAQLAGPGGQRRIDPLLPSEHAPRAVAALAPGEVLAHDH